MSESTDASVVYRPGDRGSANWGACCVRRPALRDAARAGIRRRPLAAAGAPPPPRGLHESGAAPACGAIRPAAHLPCAEP